MSLSLSVAVAQAMGAAWATTIGADATIQIRSGAKPATPESTISGSLLATIPISGSFTSASGVLTAANPAAVEPEASGSAGYFRVLTAGGTAVHDGTVTDGAGNGDMKLGSTTITVGVPLDIGVPSFTVPVA